MVAADLGVGALPQALAEPYLSRNEIEEFDPGWRPEALTFSASYLTGPGATLGQAAASLALKTAEDFHK